MSEGSRGEGSLPFRLLEPLVVDDETGEPLFEAYEVWWGRRAAVTRSQYMVLRSVIRLYERGVISAPAARLSESAFVLGGWVWADRSPARATTPMPMEVE